MINEETISSLLKIYKDDEKITEHYSKVSYLL